MKEHVHLWEVSDDSGFFVCMWQTDEVRLYYERRQGGLTHTQSLLCTFNGDEFAGEWNLLPLSITNRMKDSFLIASVMES